MNTRLTTAALSLASLAALPFASYAGTADMNACIKSFTDSHFSEQQHLKIRKEDSMTSPLGAMEPSIILLTARNTATGEIVAKASCTVSSKGEIFAMKERPATEPTLALVSGSG